MVECSEGKGGGGRRRVKGEGGGRQREKEGERVCVRGQEERRGMKENITFS